ncbi:MAG: glycosyltransferase family 2 protein [Cyclobacteriaceae bacterium]
MAGKITASIVIYKNDLRLLRNAVNSFLEGTEDSNLYLIDNSPSDRYSPFFRHPRIKYIFNNKNIGFGAGHNLALRKILADNQSTYHVILNPDVYFEPEVMGKLFSYIEAHPKVGLVMPKVLYPDGRLQPLCKLLPSPITLIRRRFLQFYPSWSNKLNHWYEMHFSGYDKIMDVPFLSGCFMFLRTDTLREVGLFDERIFLYTEDTDLTRRIHRKYRTVFYPEAVIYHYNQRGSYKNVVKFIHHVLSAITYFNKWGWFNDNERKFINERILIRFSQ